jgi:hypothetical protein
VEPAFRVLTADGTELLAEGTSIKIELPDAPDPYLFIIYNARDLAPDRSGAMFSFELDVTLTPR